MEYYANFSDEETAYKCKNFSNDLQITLKN